MFMKYSKSADKRTADIFSHLEYSVKNEITIEQESLIATSLVRFLRTTNIREIQEYFAPQVSCKTLFSIYRNNSSDRKLGIFRNLVYIQDKPKSLRQVKAPMSATVIEPFAGKSSSVINQSQRVSNKKRLYTPSCHDDRENSFDGN